MATAAVIGAAAIGAMGSMSAADTAASATQNAANQAAMAQQNTLAMQQQQLQAQIAMQQQALNQQSQLSAPYRSLGQSAIPQLEGLLGINPQPVTSAPPPLVGAPGYPGSAQPQSPYAVQYNGMGGMGGSGLPLSPAATGYANPLSAAALTAGYPTPVAAPNAPGAPGAPSAPGATAAQPGMYTPPGTTTGGLPTYAGVLGGYSNLLGSLYQAEGLNPNGTLGQGGPNTQAMTDALRNSPGYQFQLQQGNQNAVNQASAMGMSLSGNTLQSLNQFGQGLADTTYQQYINNLGNTLGQYQGYVGDYQNYLGQLMNSITLGQGAAAGQAANIGNSAAALGAAYQNAGAQSAGANNNLANIYMNQGNTLAGIGANEIAGITKSIGNAANTLYSNNTLNALNNPNGQGLYYPPPTVDYGAPSGGTTTTFDPTAGGTTTYFGG